MKTFLTFVLILALHTYANASCIDPFDQNGTCGTPPVILEKG